MFRKKGRNEETYELGEKAFFFRVQVTGFGSSEPLDARTLAATTLIDVEDFTTGEQLLEILSSQYFGPENNTISGSQIALADLYNKQETFDKALNINEKALSTLERWLGQKPRLTLDCLMKRELYNRNDSRLVQSRTVFEEVAELQKTLLDERNGQVKETGGRFERGSPDITVTSEIIGRFVSQCNIFFAFFIKS